MSGSISGAKKEGYLTKEGWKVKNWKRRWFVLGKETLSYYKSHVRLAHCATDTLSPH